MVIIDKIYAKIILHLYEMFYHVKYWRELTCKILMFRLSDGNN